MKNKLSRVSLVAMLAAGVFSVSDSPFRPVEEAVAINCDGNFAIKHVGGNVKPFNFSTVRGLKARVSAPERLELCTGINSDVSEWIAVVPGPTNPDYGNANAILQIGFSRNSLHAGGAPRMFWAAGGCSFHLPTANYAFGSFTPSGWIFLSIVRQSGGAWVLSYEDESSGSGGSVTIQSGDSAIGCWAWDQVMGQIAGETKDARNTVGYVDAHSYVRDVRFRASVGGTWYWPSQDNSAGTQMGYPLDCHFVNSLPNGNAFHCDSPGTMGDKLDFWTTH